jgi:isopenicillin N synthase-like dioxygenase
MADNRKLSSTSDYLAADETLKQFINRGFALFKIPEVVQQNLKETFSLGEKFFERSLNEKSQSRLPLDMGYRPYGVEYSQSESHPDEVESFSVGRRMGGTYPELKSMSASLLRKQMLLIFNMLIPAVEKFVSSLSKGLNSTLETEYFEGTIREWSILQLNFSRPAVTPSEYINDPHEDGCLITVMSATKPGLELQGMDGSFLPVVTMPDELLVIPGEILWLLTGGKILPTFHRVRAMSIYERRMSLLFFVDINPAMCSPWIATDINKGIDIGDRVMKNSRRFGLSEWMRQQN